MSIDLEEEFAKLVEGMGRQVRDLLAMHRLSQDEANALHAMIKERVHINEDIDLWRKDAARLALAALAGPPEDT